MYSVPRGCPGRAIFGRGSLYPSGGGCGLACGRQRPPRARTHAARRLLKGHGLVDGGLPEVAALGQERTQGADVGGGAKVVAREEVVLLYGLKGGLRATAGRSAGAGRQRSTGGAGLRQIVGGGRGGGSLAVLGGWVHAAT